MPSGGRRRPTAYRPTRPSRERCPDGRTFLPALTRIRGLAAGRTREFVPLLVGSFVPLVIMVLILDCRGTAERLQGLSQDVADGIGISAEVALVVVISLASDSLVVPALFAMLIFGLANPESRLSRLLSHTSLRFLGEISYSTYMIHYFLIDVFKLLAREDGPMSLQAFMIYIAMLLAASVVLYRMVELPSRNFLRKGWIHARLEPQARARTQG